MFPRKRRRTRIKPRRVCSAETSTQADQAATRVSAETSTPADRAATRVCAPARATRGERDADALVLLADTLLAHGAAQRSGADRYQLVVHVDADTLTARDAGGRCETDDGQPLAAETGRRLACDASLVALLHRGGRPLAVGRRTRTIGPALRRALAARDRGCRFPGCDRHTHLHAHHIQHWAHGGPTELANLVQLCHRHHRLLHEGGYTLTHRADGLQFRRPDGRVIPAHAHSPLGRAATQATPHLPRGPARPRHRRAARPRARPRRPPHPRPTAKPARPRRRGVTTKRPATADVTKSEQTTPVHRTRRPLPLAVARV